MNRLNRQRATFIRDVLPLINSGKVELLDLAKLEAQFVGLERRTARGGRDSIDHAPGGHDDLVNAACGALLRAGSHRPMRINPPRWLRKLPASAAAGIAQLSAAAVLILDGASHDDVYTTDNGIAGRATSAMGVSIGEFPHVKTPTPAAVRLVARGGGQPVRRRRCLLRRRRTT